MESAQVQRVDESQDYASEQLVSVASSLKGRQNIHLACPAAVSLCPIEAAKADEARRLEVGGAQHCPAARAISTHDCHLFFHR